MTRSRRNRLWQLTVLLIKMIFRHSQVPTWHRRNSTRHQHAISTFSFSLPSVAPWRGSLSLLYHALLTFSLSVWVLLFRIGHFTLSVSALGFFSFWSQQSFKVDLKNWEQNSVQKKWRRALTFSIRIGWSLVALARSKWPIKACPTYILIANHTSKKWKAQLSVV